MLLQRWKTAHLNHPFRGPGIQILEHLLKHHSDKGEAAEEFQFEEPVTEAELWTDLASHKVYFNLAKETNSKWDWKDFINGWGAMRDCGDPQVVTHTPLTAFDVVSTSGTYTSFCAYKNLEFGLLRCVKQLPDILKTDDAFARADEHRQGTPMLYSVYTPAFNITQPHCDCCGSGVTLIVTYGTKLVIWWEWNDEIKKKFANLHCLEKGDTLYSAVQTWPGLRWCIMHAGTIRVFSPGTVHAVLSPSNSVVSGQNFLHTDWIRNGTLRERMSWEVELVERRLRNPKWEAEGSPFGETGIVAVMEKDVDLWNSWLGSGKLNKSDGKLLSDLMKEIEKRLTDIKGLENKAKKRYNRK